MPDLGDRLTYAPFLTGVYLAVNAIRDVYLVVDGPNCAFFRTAQVAPNHDWQSDLVRSSGLHRIVDTDATPTRVAQGETALLVERLRRADGLPDCGALLLAPMSHVSITGRQYGPLLAALDPPLDHPPVLLQPGSLDGDWLDGYGDTLAAVAEHIPLQPRPPAPGARPRVAVVGHLHHRNEGDATADGAELQRLVQGLGLECVSCWPAGGTWAQLAEAGRADVVVSLPYGRRAAERLAERTGAQKVDLDLPLGLDATVRFLQQLGAATDRAAQAEAFGQQELARVVPPLEWIAEHELLGRRVLLANDPHLVAALRGALVELGCQVIAEWVFARRSHGAPPPADEVPQVLAPRLDQLPMAEDAGGPLHRRVDLVVGTSEAVELLPDASRLLPHVEVGFPAYHTHALYPQPTLGFDGLLCFASRLVNAWRQRRLREA